MCVSLCACTHINPYNDRVCFRLFVDICSGITLDCAQGTLCVTGDKPWLAICKSSASIPVFSFCPNPFFFDRKKKKT